MSERIIHPSVGFCAGYVAGILVLSASLGRVPMWTAGIAFLLLSLAFVGIPMLHEDHQ